MIDYFTMLFTELIKFIKLLLGQKTAWPNTAQEKPSSIGLKKRGSESSMNHKDSVKNLVMFAVCIKW